MAKQDQKAKKEGKGLGFGQVKYKFGKLKFFAQWFWRHTKKSLGLHNPEVEGIMVGASVSTGNISLKVVREDADVVIAMNVGGARHLIDELNKAISMVKFKG